jgi:hypothetical protein
MVEEYKTEDGDLILEGQRDDLEARAIIGRSYIAKKPCMRVELSKKIKPESFARVIGKTYGTVENIDVEISQPTEGKSYWTIWPKPIGMSKPPLNIRVEDDSTYVVTAYTFGNMVPEDGAKSLEGIFTEIFGEEVTETAEVVEG